MFKRLSVIFSSIVISYIGALLGAALMLIPLRTLPNPYSLFFNTVTFIVGVLLLIKGFLQLFSVRIDFAKATESIDSNVRQLHKSVFFISFANIIIVVFLNNISRYLGK